jgi:Secretion system C-terminal sorting domain
LPLAILNYRYNYIKTNAISDDVVDRAFYIFNDKLYENPQALGQESPFGESTLFVASPMMPNSSQANVTFSISSNLYFSNQTSTLQSIQVDLGDGSGYRTVGLGQIVSAYYGANGEKTLKVKCTLANGQVFESHSVLNVQDASLDVNLAEAPPFSYNTTPDILNETNVAGCKLSYFFHCPQQGLQKPFIFIEGFDPIPENVEGTQTFLAMLKRLSDVRNLANGQTSMLQRLYDEGYDLIYVDFTQGAGDIPANAQVVKNVIRRVNALKAQNGSTSKNRVLGASMGGVIGKWAIREMEIANENHDIDKYMTFDSPLRGANVPMGIQFMIKDIETREAYVKMRINFGPVNAIFTVKTVKIGEFIPGVQRIKGLLTAPAAKQMLFYSAFTPSGNPREWHDAFYARLAALGDLKVDYSVISNGSSINQPQLLNAGERYAAVTGTGSTSVRIFKGPNSPSIDVRVKLDLQPSAIPANGSGGVYGGSILLRLPVSSNIPLPIGLRIDVGSQINSTVSNLKPLDSAPGGFSNFGFPSQAANLSFGNVTVRGDFGTKSKGLWCFVPTFSALDIPEPANVNQSFTCTSTNTSANRCIGSVDASAFSTEIGAVGTNTGGFAHNQDHVSINQRNATFLLNQLVGSAGLNNLTTSLTRTFNFGGSDQTPSQTVFQPLSTPNVIARGLTVEGTGKLWVNRSGKINFTDENNLSNRSNSIFDLAIRRGAPACVAGNSSVIIQNGGVMQVGDVSTNNRGIVHIDAGGILDIRTGGTLTVEDNSQIIVENGGRLFINVGANINLVSSESTIYVRNGGELIINGNMIFSGDGFFQFDQGNVLTLNTDLVLNGSGRTKRMIRLNTPPQFVTNNLTVTGRGFTLSNAIVEYGNRCQINVTNGNNMNTISNVSFKAAPFGGGNSTALNFGNIANANIQNCDFRGLSQGIRISSDANLLQTVDIGNSNFNLVNNGISVISPTSGTIPANRNLLIHDCTFNYFVDGIVLGSGTACTFQNLMNRVNFDRNTLRGYQEGGLWENITGIELRNTSIRINGGLISNFKLGISAEKDVNNNVSLTGSELSNCEIGVRMIGGSSSIYSNSQYGSVEMRCTRLINNGIAGIQGTDIELGLSGFDSYGNNTFQNSTNGLLFDICYATASANIEATHNLWIGNFSRMRFRLRTGFICARGVPRRLEQCSELRQNIAINCNTRPISCCNRSVVTSDGNGGLVKNDPIFCLVSNGSTSPQTTAANKLASPTDTDLEKESGKQKDVKFMLSPNPASETVKLDIESGNYTLKVSNTVGQTIFAQNTEGSLSVDVSKWTNGIYLFEVTDKATNKRQRSKIVVQH